MSSSNRPASPLIGEVIGQRFAIREHLDGTGQADVYRAEHVLIHKDVALKVSRAGLDPADKMVARFQRVARIATQLDHPNIIKINDFGLDDRGYVFLAMELGTGRSLQRILDEDGPLTPEEVVTIGLQILEGLGEAHRRGVVHTELQPKFVMVDLASGIPAVKLLGFGLGQLMRGIERGDASLGAIRGDAARYAAPELLRSGVPSDHRADLFALGAVLFTALTGKSPWPAADGDPLARADQPAPRASQVRTDGEVTMGLDRLLSQALDPDPGRRFSDATEMASAMRRALQQDPDEVSTVEAVHRTFGRYKLLRTIARGGMGELHLAVSETLPGITKVCALKRLRPELAAEKSYVDRFLGEARLAAQLAHANVATVYDVGKAEDSFYMAMEYVVGKDCRRLIDRAGEDGIRVPPEVAIFVARELADALAYAHRARMGDDSAGLIHRDVSPTNVMVTYEGQVKLIDFGLAKHATSAGKTETGVVIGKVAYMAPEQCLGDPVDRRADIYAVGAVLYELLTGKRLREVEDLERLAELVRQPVTPNIRSLRKDVPAEMDLVLAKALAVAPEDRYQHAEGLRDDLSQVLLDLNPRMSRDVVATFLRTLFSSEARADMDRAQVLRTEAAPQRPESVLPEGGPGGMDRSRTAAMQVIDPAVLLGGSEATLASTGPKPPVGREDTVVADNPLLGLPDGSTAGDPTPAATTEPSLADAPAPRAAVGRGTTLTVAVLLLVLGLVGGFAVRDQLLPDFMRPVRKGHRGVPSAGTEARAPVGPARRPPARRPPARRPAVRPEPKGPTLAELRVKAQAELKQRLAQLAAADLHGLGVLPAELPALPELGEAHQTVTAALGGDDLGRAVSALGAFRVTLGERRHSCKRLRQAKFKWARDRLRDLRKAAPRKRADRKAFLEKHRYDALDQQLDELKKRARDRKLTCPQQSLAYAQLIPELIKTLRAAGVPDEKWLPRKKKDADDGDRKDKGKDKDKGE